MRPQRFIAVALVAVLAATACSGAALALIGTAQDDPALRLAGVGVAVLALLAAFTARLVRMLLAARRHARLTAIFAELPRRAA